MMPMLDLANGLVNGIVDRFELGVSSVLR